MATFEPVLIPGHWVTAVVTGVTAYTLAAIFYQEIRKHDISPSSWKPFSGINGAYSNVSIAQVSLPLHSSTIALAVPITGAFNKQSSNVNKRYKYKRPPLTPHTFEPPEAVDTSPPSQVSLNSSYATSTPVNSAEYCVPKLDKIEVRFPTREVPCVATFKGSYIDDTSVFFDTGEQECGTVDFARMTQFLGKDVDETGSFKVDLSEFARPGSRLGFNDEEVSDLWHDPEFRMEEQQLDAVAPLCISTLISSQEMRQPFLLPSLYARKPSMTLGSQTVFPSNPCPSLLSSASLGDSDTSSTSDDESQDWRSSMGSKETSYDWEKAASLLGGRVAKESCKAKEDKRKRHFLLARIPNLYTIDEEATHGTDPEDI